MDELLDEFYASNLDASAAISDEPYVTEADNSMGNAFDGGLVAGVEGMGASLDYFQALLGTAVGADEFAESQIASAEQHEATAGAALAGLQEFGEFLEEPTVGGALTQVAKAGGQGLPSLIYSIGSLGTGTFAGMGIGALATVSSRKAAERLVKESLEKVARDAANPDDLALAQAAYNLAKRAAEKKVVSSAATSRTAAKIGAGAGLTAAEFPSLAGENFSEALGAGENRDLDTALRSALVAVPQTVVGVGAEAAFLKAIAKSAAKRSTGEKSIFGQLATNVATQFPKGAALEGTSEYLQSEIAIQNRKSYDSEYSDEHANIRRMESAFAGAVIGGFAGGAGAIGSTALQNRGTITDASKAKVDAVFEKARSYQNQAETKREYDKQDAEEEALRRAQDDDRRQDEQQGDQRPDENTEWEENQKNVSAELAAFSQEDTAEYEALLASLPPQEDNSPTQQNDGVLHTTERVTSKGERVVTKVTQDDTKVDEEGYKKTTFSATRNGEPVMQGGSGVPLDTLGYEVAADSIDIFQDSPEPLDLTTAEIKVFEVREGPDGNVSATVKIEGSNNDRDQIQLKKTTPVQRSMETFEPTEGPAKSDKDAASEIFGAISYGQQPTNSQAGYVGTTRESSRAAPKDLEPAREEFRNTIGANLAKLAEENPDNKRLVTLEKQYREADTARKNEILSVLYAEKTELQRTDNRTDDEVRAESNEYFSENAGFSENTETIKTDGYSRRSDVSREYKDTAALRAEFDTLFGEQNWSSDMYGGMSDSFLRQAIKAKKDDKTVAGESESSFEFILETPPPSLDLTTGKTKKSKPKYVIRKTSFVKDRDAVNTEVVMKAFSDAKRSQFATPDVQLVEPGLEPKSVNLADLTNAGRALVQERGNDTYQGDNLTQSSRQGLSEFISELAEFNAERELNGEEPFVINVRGKSIFELTADDLQGPRGRVVAGRANGTDLALSDLLSSKGTKGKSRVVVKDNKQDVETDYNSNNLVSVEFTHSSGEQYSIRREGNISSAPLLTLATARKEVVRLESDGFKAEIQLTPKRSFKVSSKNLDREEFANTAEQADSIKKELEEDGATDVVIADPVNNENLGQDKVADGMSETESFGLNSGPQGAVRSRLNLESNPDTEINRGVGSRNSSGRSARRSDSVTDDRTYSAAQYPLGELGKLATDFINKTLAKIKPKKPVIVLGLKEIQDASYGAAEKVNGLFADEDVLENVRAAAFSLQTQPNKHGHYIGFTNAHVIIVDNVNTTNDLETALVSAHEALGHVLFQEEIHATLQQKPLRERLMADFEKARAAKDAPAQYQGEHGFEEWFADQTAIVAKNIYINSKKEPTGIVGKTFVKIAAKLKAMWQSLSSEFKRRFGKESYSVNFEDYIQNTIIKEREHLRKTAAAISTSEVSYSQKALVRAMEEAGKKEELAITSIVRNFKEHVDGTASGHTMFKLLLPEDNILRGISPLIADMMYVRSNTRSLANNQFGYHKSKDHMRGIIYDELEQMLGTDWDTDEIKLAFDQAANQDVKTADLDGKAREIRDWLDNFYNSYIAKTPGNSIQKRADYFPVALSMAKIYNNETARRWTEDNPEQAESLGVVPDQTFYDLVMEFTTMSESQVKTIMDGMVARQQSILDDNEITFDPKNPQSVVEKARVLTENIPSDRLKPFLESPEAALMKYIRHVITRSEWKRATYDSEGKDQLAVELEKLTPAKRTEVEATLARYLGYTDTPLNPHLSKAMSWLQLFNWVTLLPLATVGSIPEFGGAIINTREFNGFGMARKAIMTRIQNPEQAIQLARSIGVTHSTVMGNLGLTEADAEYLDPRVRKWSDKFFSAIGLDYFTRYTREFASVMAVEFLLEHAYNTSNNKRSGRYLADHGARAREIKAWHAKQKDGGHYTFDGPEGAAVKAAIQRFVDNSMLKPNAAERTSWGNDPKYQLIWALKSYLMSFGKVILGGIKREMQARIAEGDTTLEQLSSVGMMGLLTFAAFMPLAALSLELREIAKAGLAGALPFVDANARYFRSDRMDMTSYLGELFDRGGLAGPYSIFGMVGKSAEWGEAQGLPVWGQVLKGLGPIFGPTYGFVVDDIGLGLYSGKGWDVVPARIIPGYSLVL